MSNGGRDDLEYQLSYQIATSSEPTTIYGRVNMTEGVITGLRPFTQYVVFVSSENGVSAQDTDVSGRTVSAPITTLEGGEFCSLMWRKVEGINMSVLKDKCCSSGSMTHFC